MKTIFALHKCSGDPDPRSSTPRVTLRSCIDHDRTAASEVLSSIDSIFLQPLLSDRAAASQRDSTAASLPNIISLLRTVNLLYCYFVSTVPISLAGVDYITVFWTTMPYWFGTSTNRAAQSGAINDILYRVGISQVDSSQRNIVLLFSRVSFC